MTTTNQGLSFAEIEQIVAQQVARAMETIAIYVARTRVARDSRNQVEHQEDKVAENSRKKRKWEVQWLQESGSLIGLSPLQPHKDPLVVKRKTNATCYECGMLGHYKSICPKWKSLKHVNKL
ncbi:reverse transcriptase domain-containing protein [Tanacetum coccineum]